MCGRFHRTVRRPPLDRVCLRRICGGEWLSDRWVSNSMVPSVVCNGPCGTVYADGHYEVPLDVKFSKQEHACEMELLRLTTKRRRLGRCICPQPGLTFVVRKPQAEMRRRSTSAFDCLSRCPQFNAAEFCQTLCMKKSRVSRSAKSQPAAAVTSKRESR